MHWWRNESTNPPLASASLGEHLMLSERSRRELGEQPRRKYCSPSVAEESEAETREPFPHNRASFREIIFIQISFIVTIISTLCKLMQFLVIHDY